MTHKLVHQHGRTKVNTTSGEHHQADRVQSLGTAYVKLEHERKERKEINIIRKNYLLMSLKEYTILKCPLRHNVRLEDIEDCVRIYFTRTLKEKM